MRRGHQQGQYRVNSSILSSWRSQSRIRRLVPRGAHRRPDRARRPQDGGHPMNAHTPIDETNTTAVAVSPPLLPNMADISAHLYAMFDPAFVQVYPDAWIEIAFSYPGHGSVDEAKNYRVFELKEAAEFAEAKNKAGFNIYVGVALRHGKEPRSGRAKGEHVLVSRFAWVEFDGAGDDERVAAILKEHNLAPTLVVTTGKIPHRRAPLFFKLAGTGAATSEKLAAANTSLMKLLDTDAVQDANRILRL